jgi:hypothetical protein
MITTEARRDARLVRDHGNREPRILGPAAQLTGALPSAVATDAVRVAHAGNRRE